MDKITILLGVLTLLIACSEQGGAASEGGSQAPLAGSTGGSKADEVSPDELSCPEPVGLDCEQCPESEPEPEPEPSRRELNLNIDADNLYAWRKVRASLDTEQDVVFYWSGYVYHYAAKDPADYAEGSYNVSFESPLFRFEGFNVARFADDGAGGYVMLSREVSVYQDPRSGQILDCWRNELLEAQPFVSVMHVANDPVNYGVGQVSHLELGDRVSFFSDILVSYRSPLAAEPSLSPFSASDVYQSNELFNFYASREDLEDESLETVPAEISWTRVGQYLPWMQMGDRPGQLIYHVRGYKVLDGVDGLPEPLRRWTEDVAGASYLSAPEMIPQSYEPNATTWRVFRAAYEAGEYTPECD